MPDAAVPEVAEMVDRLAAAVDGLVEADPAALGSGEAVEALQRQLSRLEGVAARSAAAFDAGGEWATVGARSAAAWLARRCRLPLGAARRSVRLGRALRAMPRAEAAWLSGDIGSGQVGLLAAARTPSTADAFERDEAMLVSQAGSLRHDQFGRVLAYWCQLADPDGVEDDAARRVRARRCHLSAGLDGLRYCDAVFEPIGGAIFERVLEAITAELFDADWADARARLGDRATAGDLSRTPAQRRHDALVEMATRAAAMPAGARRPEPLFTVLVGYETLAGRICELANGTPVTPGSLLPWLSEAWVERAVFDGPDRVMNIGVRRRLFGGATRRAVEVRDRECFHPYCDLRAEHCQIDHIEPWAAGGPTTDDNGRPACPHHNRLRHRRTGPPP